VPLSVACGGDLPEPGSDVDSETPGQTANARVPTDAEPRRTGTLSVEGGALAAPGDYELNTSCSYARGSGSFSFGLHPEMGSQAEEGASTFGMRAGWGPRNSVPLENGTYPAVFEYAELTAEGPVLSYSGEGEMSIRLVDDSRASFPLVDVDASGTGDGMRFRAHGVCQAMVMG
jgi:hypothetical protein